MDRDVVTNAKILVETLNCKVTAGSWKPLLELFVPTGVADMVQIQKALSLVRDKARQLIEQVQACHGDLPPIIETLQQSTQRAGVRGRTPTIYRLGPSGAAILRSLGYKDIKAANLIEPIAVQHAVLMLDVRLAALEKGLRVITDAEFQYGADNVLRPDHQVWLSGDCMAFFEIEQSGKPGIMPRVLKSVQHKKNCFLGIRKGRVSPDVRMLLNVARGPDWDRTTKVWSQACSVAADGKPLPFRLLAIPLVEFLDHPDWGEEPDPNRWLDLTKQPSQTKALQLAKSQAPTQLLNMSPEEYRLLMLALWQQFLETKDAPRIFAARPNPVFFEIMRIVFNASHGEEGDLIAQASVPRASIYLLNQYLLANPDLKQYLKATINRGIPTLRWNLPIILQKMQVVINAFLKYHGWRNGKVLRATAGMYDFDSVSGAGLCVTVRIVEPELLMLPGQEVVPSRYEVKQAEEALGWVLLALFAYAEHLDLPLLSFW